MRGGRLVVVLHDLRTVAMLGGELEPGQEVVRERVVQFPDLVEQVELGFGVTLTPERRCR